MSSDQSIGMMDGAYFVGRNEILSWINQTLSLDIQKIETTANGAVACQLLDSLYPGKVPMHKVNWEARNDYEFIGNYKILQDCFNRLHIDRHVDVDKLVRAKYQDNLEFMQWFKGFADRNSGNSEGYDAVGRRARGRGGQTYTGSTGGAARGGAAAAAPRAARSTAAAPATRRTNAAAASSAADAAPAAPAAPAKTGTGGRAAAAAAAADASKENHANQNAAAGRGRNVDRNTAPPAAPRASADPVSAAKIEELTAQNQDLLITTDGLEKERDFYFNKLRDIEVLCQALPEEEQTQTIKRIFKILYATEEDSEAGGEGEAEAEAAGSSAAVAPESAAPLASEEEAY